MNVFIPEWTLWVMGISWLISTILLIIHNIQDYRILKLHRELRDILTMKDKLDNIIMTFNEKQETLVKTLVKGN